MEFSRQEYWSGLPFPVSRHLSNPGINSGLLYCRQILYHQATVFIMDNFWKCYYKTSKSGCYPSFSYRYLGNMNWVDPQRGQTSEFKKKKKTPCFSHKQPAAAAAKSLQSCPTLCDPMDCSPPGFPVTSKTGTLFTRPRKLHKILQIKRFKYSCSL